MKWKQTQVGDQKDYFKLKQNNMTRSKVNAVKHFI